MSLQSIFNCVQRDPRIATTLIIDFSGISSNDYENLDLHELGETISLYQPIVSDFNYLFNPYEYSQSYQKQITGICEAFKGLQALESVYIKLQPDYVESIEPEEFKDCFINNPELRILEFITWNDKLTNIDFIGNALKSLQNLEELYLSFTHNKIANLDVFETAFQDLVNLKQITIILQLNKIQSLEPLGNALKNSEKLEYIYLNLRDNYDLENLDSLYTLLDENKYSTVTQYYQHSPFKPLDNIDLTSYRQGYFRKFIDVYTGQTKYCPNLRCYSCYDQSLQCKECLNENLSPPGCISDSVSTINCNSSNYSELIECIDKNKTEGLKKITINTQNLGSYIDKDEQLYFLWEKICNLTNIEELELHMRTNDIEYYSLNGIYQNLQQLKVFSLNIKQYDSYTHGIDIFEDIQYLKNLEKIEIDLTNANYSVNFSNLSNLKQNEKIKKIMFKMKGNDFFEMYETQLQTMLDNTKFDTVASYTQEFDDLPIIQNYNLTKVRAKGGKRQYLDITTGKLKDCFQQDCESCYEQINQCSSCLNKKNQIPDCNQNENENKNKKNKTIIFIVVGVVAAILLAVLCYFLVTYYKKKQQEKQQQEEEQLSLQEQFQVEENTGKNQPNGFGQQQN